MRSHVPSTRPQPASAMDWKNKRISSTVNLTSQLHVEADGTYKKIDGRLKLKS
ncbi:hypothetical protein [Nostoc sp. JL33]|uniref:hypothetical protein n=1 Tax=Nostoc sp. JL33 TaxID=2815396 RepID=UPI0025E63584|nr:hypothetical protein [Nostoc sp. JL33]